MANQDFMVTSPHTKEECLNSLDEIAANGGDALAKWEWGCMSGDHTGYATISASSVSEALKTVPEKVRSKARAVQVTKMTPEQVASFHR